MREKVLEEILATEKTYVKTLQDIIQGFKIPFEANPNLTVEQTNRIFGNIEQLYKFQTSFLAELELANESVSIPAIFVSWAAKFEVYAEYCNNFCLAQHLLARLSKLDSFNNLSEKCRQDRGLIRLKLADFLLVPIQRICKYKILLADLVKNTDQSHSDYHVCTCALTDIESVTKKINESKKKFEETINVNNFQLNIKLWRGKDLSDRSFVQIHSGSLRRRLADHDTVSLVEEREVTLFDNQMAICYTNSSGDKVLEERIDLNHVTVIFDDANRRIKIECHFKKFSRVIELTADDAESYEVWKEKLSFELKFNDINENKENADHIMSDHTTRTKLRQGSGHRRSPRNSIGHLFETMRKKKPEAYKTL